MKLNIKSALFLLVPFTALTTTSALANTTQPTAKVFEIKDESKPSMAYKFSVEEQAKIEAVEKAATSRKGSAFDKKNLDIVNAPSASKEVNDAPTATVAATAAVVGGTATIATAMPGANALKDSTPATVASQPANDQASQPVNMPPLFKSLASANAAGINPLASAPKIGAPEASVAKAETVAAPDLSTSESILDRISKNIVKLVFGLALIGGGIWLFLRKD